MDLDEIRKILRFMEENGLVELEHEAGGKRIKLRRGEASVPVVPTAPIAAPAPAPAAPQAAAPAPGDNGNLIEFKSPLVGTFYRASKPDADPFVSQGDAVTADKVVCIIEAMKVMNEIKAELEGTVKEVLVKNGQAVEFGEPLFLIEKKK